MILKSIFIITVLVSIIFISFTLSDSVLVTSPSSHDTPSNESAGHAPGAQTSPDHAPVPLSGKPLNPTLAKYFPDGYDKYVPPTNEEGGALNIMMSVKARDVQKIDEVKMDITIEWFVRMYWIDKRLLPPGDLPDGVWENISPSITSFTWLPSTYIDHVREISKPTLLIKPESFRMQNNGLIRYSISVTTRVSCPMDFTAYPFDKQSCYFSLESYQLDYKQVRYSWFGPEVEVAENIKPVQFEYEFQAVPQQNTLHHNRSWPRLDVKIELRRRITYYFLNTFIPSSMFVFVSWLTFLVPIDQVPARMVLTITTLLTMVSMFSSVRTEGPKVSYAKAVDQWMLLCVAMVFGVLVEYAVALRLKDKARKLQNKAVEATQTLNNAFPAKTGNFARKTSTISVKEAFSTGSVAPTTDVGRDKTVTGLPQGIKEKLLQNAAAPIPGNIYLEWQIRVETYSPAFFSSFFLVCNIAYWTYWLT